MFNFLRGSDTGEYRHVDPKHTYSKTSHLRCVGTNRGGSAEAKVRVEVVEEGFDMTAVIAGSSAAAVVMLFIIALILHYIRSLKMKVRTSCSNSKADLLPPGSPVDSCRAPAF